MPPPLMRHKTHAFASAALLLAGAVWLSALAQAPGRDEWPVFRGSPGLTGIYPGTLPPR